MVWAQLNPRAWEDNFEELEPLDVEDFDDNDPISEVRSNELLTKGHR